MDLEEIKIRYITFKNKQKFNLKQNSNGKLVQGDTPIGDYILQNEAFELEKIILTKIGKKEGDSVIISSYDPSGDERNLEFEFKHYCNVADEWYIVKILWKKERSFMSSFFGQASNNGYWEVEICLEEDRTVKTDIRTKGTDASLELFQILECSEKSLNEKVVEIIQGFKYTKVKKDVINLSLF